jgi:hypothetical protein
VAAYFKGASPFTGIKARKDFPDAFVYEAVADLSVPQAARHLAAVTADEYLRKQLSWLPGVTCFQTLTEFVESNQVRELTAAVALEARWRDEPAGVIAALKENETHLISTDFINSFLNTVAHRRVDHPSVPSDNGDATASMVDDPSGIEIEWNEAEDYGPRVLRVSFSWRPALFGVRE